jgi:hypothetical protein
MAMTTRPRGVEDANRTDRKSIESARSSVDGQWTLQSKTTTLFTRMGSARARDRLTESREKGDGPRLQIL